MAPTQAQDSIEPLLGRASKKADSNSLPPIDATSQTAIKAISIIRIATGALFLAAPRFSVGLFRYNVPAEQLILVRMFGIRDLVFGELTITAEDKNSADGGRREIRRALWAGIAADGIDLGSIALAVASGHLSKPVALMFAAGAASAVGLSALGLRGL